MGKWFFFKDMQVPVHASVYEGVWVCTSVFKGACICAIVFAGMQYAQVSFKVQASVFVGVRLCMIVFESMWAGANIL